MMHTKPLPSLDARRYAETFAVFLQRSLEYDLMTAEIERVISTRVRGPIRMLDIGAGTGCVIADLAQRPGLAFAGYAAFEPNPSHAQVLQTLLTKLPFSAQLQTRGFDEDVQIEGQHDFVLFSHSLYWMRDPAAAMLHAAASLAPGGVAMALIQGPYGAHAMFHLFEDQYLRLSPMLQNNRISSHELVAGLLRRGVEPEVRILKTPVDLTGLFDAGQDHELGEFMSFLLQLEYRDLPHRLQRDIAQYVEGGCVETDGRLLWYLPNASVVISRPLHG
jgi:SAM-dependent methyltransferase